MKAWKKWRVGFLAAVASCAAVSGCEVVDEEALALEDNDEFSVSGGLTQPSSVTGKLSVDPAPVDASLGCVDWRWIGLRRDGLSTCPVPPGLSQWTVSPLFSGTSVPPQLRSFCVYEYSQGLVPDLAAIKALVRSGDLTRADRDCLAVSPLADGPLQAAIAAPLQQVFWNQTGRPNIVSNGAKPTRLAFIDDLPTRTPAQRPETLKATERHGEHGYAMANLAKDLVCSNSDQTCAAEISSRLAIKTLKFDRTQNLGPTSWSDKGGGAGMLSDLAMAIRQEIEAFDSSTSHNGRMVINLSLGWRGKFGGSGTVSAMPTPVQAVFRALEYASCKGVITVAASGNRVFGPSASEGPFYPAAWESVAAPSATACLSRYGVSVEVPYTTGTQPYRPIVYSAGGHSSLGYLFSMAQPGGTPRLVAFGDHATTTGRADGLPTTPMTGTSVSAAVVSATAAAAWYYRPELRSDLLMETIYVSDAEIAGAPAGSLDWAKLAAPYSSDYGLPAGSPVRRVDTCRTLHLVCPKKSGLCPNPSDFKCGTWVKALPEIPALTTESFTDEIASTALPLIDIDLIALTPAVKYSDILDAPWLKTQPGDHFCPGCVNSFSATRAYFSISNPYSANMINPTLYVGGNAYSLGTMTIAPGSTATVANPIYSSAVTYSPTMVVYISFSLGTTGLSATNALLVAN